MPRKSDKSTAIDKNIGIKINELRATRGITLQHLADKIDVSHQQLRKYIDGTNRIAACRLFDVAKALQVDMNEFFVNSGSRYTYESNYVERLIMAISKNFRKIKSSDNQEAVHILVRTLAENN